jgi:hypothetical protein
MSPPCWGDCLGCIPISLDDRHLLDARSSTIIRRGNAPTKRPNGPTQNPNDLSHRPRSFDSLGDEPDLRAIFFKEIALAGTLERIDRAKH